MQGVGSETRILAGYQAHNQPTPSFLFGPVMARNTLQISGNRETLF